MRLGTTSRNGDYNKETIQREGCEEGSAMNGKIITTGGRERERERDRE